MQRKEDIRYTEVHLLGDNEDDESDRYGIYSVSKKAKDAIVINRVLKRLIFQWN
jgi:hypothetical protein